MKFLVVLSVCLLGSGLLAQAPKQEQEQRVDAREMPAKALLYLQNLAGKKKRIRYYREQDGARRSFEAKFKLEGSKYSVEFDENGALEDIEIERKAREMGRVRNTIEAYLEKTYARHKIEKIQAQYKPQKEFNSLNPGNPDAWELIVATKDAANKFERYEITFDAAGNYLNSRNVVRRSYEFLLF